MRQLAQCLPSVGLGWRVLIRETHDMLYAVDADYVVTSWWRADGELRVLVASPRTALWDWDDRVSYTTVLSCWVGELEALSGRRCEMCGGDGRPRDLGHAVRTLCGERECEGRVFVPTPQPREAVLKITGGSLPWPGIVEPYDLTRPARMLVRQDTPLRNLLPRREA